MPTTHLYMIVTNDEYEFPLKCDIVGAKAASEYLGIKVNYLNKCICLNKWSHMSKKKAVIIGTKEDLDEIDL